MRRFLVLGHKAPIDSAFSLSDLPGGAGRLDVLCRAVGASLFLSHGIRDNVETVLLLRNAAQIRFVGAELRRLNPDERSTAAVIRHALDVIGPEEIESTPGVFVSRSTLSDALDRLYQLEATPILLHEDGEPAETYGFPEHPAFVLSDHMEFSDDELSVLADLPRVSVGTTSLHTSQVITIVHFLLDRLADDLHSDLALCHVVWGEPKAQLIRGLLDDFGIPCNLVGHVPASVYPMALNGLASVRIMVRRRDLERARAIISDYFEEPVEE